MKVEIVTSEELTKELQACARGIYGIVYPDGKTHDKPFVVDLAKEIGTLAALNTPDIVWLSRTPDPSPIEILKKIIAAPEPDPNPAAVEEAQPAAGGIDADPEETPYKEPEAEQAEVTEESAEPAPAEMPEESAEPVTIEMPEESAEPAPMEMPEESAELVSAETPEEPAEPAPAEKTKTRGGAPKDLGEWAKYQGRALSTSEQNEVIAGMTAEGYSTPRISLVVRLSQPTVRSRLKKMQASGGDQQ